MSSPAGRRGDRRLPLVYYPVPLDEGSSLKLLLRLDGPPAAAAHGLRDLVRRLDDRLPIGTLTTGTQMREEWGGEKRWLAIATAVLGVAALVLASAGLFSVVAYVVALRRREIAIRMTLGANGSTVVAMILRQALIPTAVGCLAGAVSCEAGLALGGVGVSPVALDIVVGWLVGTPAGLALGGVVGAHGVSLVRCGRSVRPLRDYAPLGNPATVTGNAEILSPVRQRRLDCTRML